MFSIIMRRLERDRPSIKSVDRFRSKEVLQAIASPKTIIAFIMSFMVGTMAYGLALFLPSIVSELGFSPNKTQLLTIGPFAAGFCGECFFWKHDIYLKKAYVAVYPSSDFNFCNFVRPLRSERCCSYPCLHLFHCRLRSLPGWWLIQTFSPLTSHVN